MGTITSNRRILVVGSQCASLPPLSFLPQAAVDLHAVMTDPEVGGCTDAAPRGLLIDPTVAEAKAAIKEAFRAAAAEGATLLLALIGHGTHAGCDFYLLPHDGVEPPDSDTGVQLVQLVKEQHRRHPGLDGLVVLIDTCFSGVGALAAATYWVSELEGALRFEVLTAAADRPAYDGCFTRRLVACLREGLDGIPGEYLRSEHVRRVIEGLCPHQKPQHPTYNADEGLYLAKNVVHARRSVGPSWAGTAAAETIQRLTAWLQPTPVLHEVVARSQEGRYVAVVGHAGSGKSALAAAPGASRGDRGNGPVRFRPGRGLPHQWDAHARGRVDAVRPVGPKPARVRRNPRPIPAGPDRRRETPARLAPARRARSPAVVGWGRSHPGRDRWPGPARNGEQRRSSRRT